MLQFTAGILVLACTYMLIASGYVVVYRASRVLNFAQGSLFLLTGFIAFTIGGTIFGSQPVLVFLSAAVIGFLVGIVIYWGIIKRILGENVFVTVMVSVGIWVLLEGVVLFVWGPSPKALLSPMNMVNTSYALPFGIKLALFDLLAIGAAVFCVAGLLLFDKFSRLGKQMRASCENTLLASQRGINVNFISALTWGIAGLLAAIAGSIYGANASLSIVMILVGVKAFPVAMVGGMTSVIGLVPGGLIVALIEALCLRYGDPLLGNVAPMVILLLVLIFRPWGLFGRVEEIERI